MIILLKTVALDDFFFCDEVANSLVIVIEDFKEAFKDNGVVRIQSLVEEELDVLGNVELDLGVLVHECFEEFKTFLLDILHLLGGIVYFLHQFDDQVEDEEVLHGLLPEVLGLRIVGLEVLD